MAYGYRVYFTERPKHRVIGWDPDRGTTEIVAGDPSSRTANIACILHPNLLHTCVLVLCIIGCGRYDDEVDYDNGMTMMPGLSSSIIYKRKSIQAIIDDPGRNNEISGPYVVQIIKYVKLNNNNIVSASVEYLSPIREDPSRFRKIFEPPMLSIANPKCNILYPVGNDIAEYIWILRSICEDTGWRVMHVKSVDIVGVNYIRIPDLLTLTDVKDDIDGKKCYEDYRVKYGEPEAIPSPMPLR